MNGGIINSITRLHLVGYFYWVLINSFLMDSSSYASPTILITQHTSHLWPAHITFIFCKPLNHATEPSILKLDKNIRSFKQIECLLLRWKQAKQWVVILIKLQLALSWISSYINHLKSTGYVMHHQFNIQQPYALSTLYLCVLYLSENKQRLVPLTA